jgi:hypothetical protein
LTVTAAAGLHHARRHLRHVAELHAALLDVGTGDVDLDGVDRRVVEAARDLDVLLDGRAADVGDEARLAEVQRRQDLVDHMIDAGILQADGVEHAGRRLVHPVRWIAQARLAGGALEHDRPGIAVAEPLHTRVFLAKADAARQQHDRRGELQPAESDRQ